VKQNFFTELLRSVLNFCFTFHPDFRHHWGYRMRHKYCAFSVLRVTSFLFTNSQGYRDTIDKWSLAPFEVQELTEEDLKKFPEEKEEDSAEEETNYD